MVVLVVDDSRIIRDRLVNMLSSIDGVDLIAEAEDGQMAIKVYDRLRPDAVILDIRMRDINGIQLLKRFKRETPTPTIIMLTNFAYPQYRRKCYEEGADYFLDKSAQFSEITEIVGSLANRPGHMEYPRTN